MIFDWRKKRTPMPEPEFRAAVCRQAQRMGIPDERRDELIERARNQIIVETGNCTMYDALRRAADLAKNS